MASTSKIPLGDSDDDFSDIDAILNAEASVLVREQEVSRFDRSCFPSANVDKKEREQVLRVVGAFKLNPYDVLDLNFMPGGCVTDQDIRELAWRSGRVTRTEY